MLARTLKVAIDNIPQMFGVFIAFSVIYNSIYDFTKFMQIHVLVVIFAVSAISVLLAHMMPGRPAGGQSSFGGATSPIKYPAHYYVIAVLWFIACVILLIFI